MTTGFDLDEIERRRERLGSVSSAMMEGDNLAILLCGYFDNPDQDGSDDDCGWTPDALTGYTQVCDAIHAHYAPTLTAMIAEIRELRAENARLRGGIEKHLEMLEHGYAPFVEDRLSEAMCCSGQMCGCKGASVGEYLAHLLREGAGLTRVALGEPQ